jgi:Uma2 family endonuclease
MFAMTATLEAPPKRFTAEEALAWVGDENPWELIEGRRVDLMPGGWQHSRVIRALDRSLSRFVEDHGLGEVLTSETGVLLSRDPDTIRAADLAFVPATLSPAQAPSGWVTIIPALVIEVVSPTDRSKAVESEALSWLETGAQMVWIVDPIRRTVKVHRPEGATSLGMDGVLDGGDVLPDFRLRVREIFEP